MKKFRFKVINSSLNIPKYENFVWEDLADAKNRAWEDWYTILSLDNEIKEVKWNFIILRKNISSKKLISFFENLWDYLDCHFTVKDSIERIKRNSNNIWYYNKFLEDLYISVESWQNLYEAINKSESKKFFTYNQLEMIRVGIDSNNLPEILVSLVDELELEQDIRKDMIAVSIMPSAAIILMSVCSWLLFLYIIPMVIKAIGKIDHYPFLTSILIWSKDFFVDYKYFIGAFIFLLFLTPKLMRMSELWNYMLDKFLINIPWFKWLFKTRIYLQIAKILELTSKSRFKSQEKMVMLSRWIGNAYYRKYFESKIDEIIKWNEFCLQFNDLKLFSYDLADKIQIWDSSQMLDKKMEKYFKKTLRDFKRVINNIKVLLNTIIIIIMWIFVFFFAGWILQLMISLNETIK